MLAKGQRFYLYEGDNRHLLGNMGDGVVDSIVCDPPYELTSISKRFGPGSAPQQYGRDGAFQRAARGFMQCTWDATGIPFDAGFWAECLRVLKPGGYLLGFGGTRTYHRLACAIEDAGFEIRDCIFWLYGSGFPKSHDVSKAIDRAAGAERTKVVGESPWNARKPNGSQGVNSVGFNDGGRAGAPDIMAPATPEAAAWSGWGTALKPACEPIVMARKPLVGTVAQNVLAYGTGAINIDACRVPGAPKPLYADGINRQGASPAPNDWGERTGYEKPSAAARFPANVAHDGSDEVLAGFPYTANNARASKGKTGEANSTGVLAGGHRRGAANAPADSGSAARFFYCAKASKSDRDEGCDQIPVSVVRAQYGEQGQGPLAQQTPRTESAQRNIHPTVKPTDLMRWLVRMVTPPGGLVFDPFTGSGSTGKAALLEGCRFLGAELTAEYVPIALARLTAASLAVTQAASEGI